MRGLGGVFHLLNRPLLAGLWIIVKFSGRKGIKLLVIGRMHSNKLALQMGRKFGDLDAGVSADPLYFVAIFL